MESVDRSCQSVAKSLGGRELTKRLFEAIRTRILMWELVPGGFLVGKQGSLRSMG